MKLKVQLSWKVLVGGPEDSVDYTENSKLFNVRTGKTFLKLVGGTSSLDFLPYTLEPTNVFYNAIDSIKRDSSFSGKKFPFKCKKENAYVNLERVNIKIHRYSNKIVVLLVSTDSIEFQGDTDALLNLQRLENHIEIYNLVKVVCGLINSGGKSNQPINYTPKTFPYIAVQNINNDDVVPDDIAVKILTRHKNAKPEIVENVISKNIDHQIDENSILIDRQGIFARYSSELGGFNINKRKFESAHRLLELSIVISKIIIDGDFFNLRDDEQFSIKNLINSPNVVFIKSVTAYKTWALLLEEFHLKSLYEHSVASTFKKKEGIAFSKNEWSESRKWLMGILSVLTIGILAWVGSMVINKIDSFSQDSVRLLNPIDGYNIQIDSKAIEFIWDHIKDAQNYILFIEIYHDSKQKWIPSPDEWRYIVKENKKSVLIKRTGRFRWRIIAKNNNEEKVGESTWYYFNSSMKKAPNKANEADVRS